MNNNVNAIFKPFLDALLPYEEEITFICEDCKKEMPIGKRHTEDFDRCKDCITQYPDKTGHCSAQCRVTGNCDDSC